MKMFAGVLLLTILTTPTILSFSTIVAFASNTVFPALSSCWPIFGEFSTQIFMSPAHSICLARPVAKSLTCQTASASSNDHLSSFRDESAEVTKRRKLLDSMRCQRSTIRIYAAFLGLLTTASFQAHIIYLHKIQMTWSHNLNVPETFGFLHNQVTPFYIPTSSGENIMPDTFCPSNSTARTRPLCWENPPETPWTLPRDTPSSYSAKTLRLD